MGGKTGTGDNRIEAIGAGGRVLVPSPSTAPRRSCSTSASTTSAPSPHSFRASAQQFTFTSALPVQVLKGMAPILTPYLQPDAQTLCQPPKQGVSYAHLSFE